MGRWWIAIGAAVLSILAGVGVAGLPSSVPDDQVVHDVTTTTVAPGG